MRISGDSFSSVEEQPSKRVFESNDRFDNANSSMTQLFNRCTHLARYGPLEELHRFIVASEEYINQQPNAFETILKIFDQCHVPQALKSFFKIVGSFGNRSKAYEFVARQIIFANDMILFLDELTQLNSCGFPFQSTMINALMEYSMKNYDLNFMNFVLKDVINHLHQMQLDDLNQPLFHKFCDQYCSLRKGFMPAKAWVNRLGM